MKKLFKIFTLSSIIIASIVIVSCNKDDNSPVAAASCLPTNLQNGVIAAYTFGNGSLNDSSGNGYHLTNTTTASPGADRAGNSNCAFHFTNANNEFLTYVNPVFLNNFDSQPFSISLWYKNENIQTNGGFELLIGRDTGMHCPDTSGQWSVALYDLRKPVIGINKHSLWASEITVGSYAVSQWRHLVVTCQGTNLQLFVDGVSTNSVAGFGCGGDDFDAGNFGDLFLGKDFDGFLDDVVIYNRILSQTEINQLYNLPTCCM
ncbi:LamG domain-containing protein [Flavobacterium sp. I3-2]|uniref:LamG domain-containing protein n=1 Tax=Flavobacterium sp. I3-2 TaxID=2748319 RepID=UPI0015AA98E0|nr:LamG domain-containing protein [Flavobacterium sp. I3-2]